MQKSRIAHSIATGQWAAPKDQDILIVGPDIDHDLSMFDSSRVNIVSPSANVAVYLTAKGYHTTETFPDTGFDAAIVFMPKEKARAKDWIARASSLVRSGSVLIDGPKIHGIDSLLKEAKSLGVMITAVAKAHGKLAICNQSDPFSQWRQQPSINKDGFWTAPGVFSEERVDAGSELLARNLEGLKGKVIADLGGGWGFLTCALLQKRPDANVTLFENDADALTMARANVEAREVSSQVVFEWADVTREHRKDAFDAVVMNPPFHAGRKTDISLGCGFIASAEQFLKPGGELWMVANRHLPYENTLRNLFASVAIPAQDTKFTVFHAIKARAGRGYRAKARKN